MNSFSDVHHHFPGTHYVVSEDIDILISRWCSGTNLLPPGKEFYLGLRSKMKDFLQDVFARVTFISSQEIRDGLLEAIAPHKEAGLTAVSLERAYLEDSEMDKRIELTRTVDNQGEDIVIPAVRNGTPLKRYQFQGLRSKNIVLIDDVVFSGKTMISTINELTYHNANVHAVVAAVGVKKGVDNLKKAKFGVIGMPENMTIDCLEEFDNISDQVCERDFYPGVPYSGREHFGYDKASFPYLLPFGRPNKWASIPEKEVMSFSVLCLENTAALFGEIERINGITIPCSMVPRPVFGFPGDQTRFVSFLERAREKCLKT
ncbi:MAG: hypothetical protein WA058_00305 [Minisyncoccia bacterium]